MIDNHSNNTGFSTPHIRPPSLIADSGSSGNFATLDLPVTNKRRTTHPITIQLPNGNHVTSTHKADLDLPMLLPAARHVHLVPGLHNYSLLSIGQLCDAGYHITFGSASMKVFHDDVCILQGSRSSHTKLWHINSVAPAPAHLAATAIANPKTAELVAFAHANLFPPCYINFGTGNPKWLSNQFPWSYVI